MTSLREFQTGDTMTKKHRTYRAVRTLELNLDTGQGVCQCCELHTKPFIYNNCAPCTGVVWMTQNNFILHRLKS